MSATCRESSAVTAAHRSPLSVHVRGCGPVRVVRRDYVDDDPLAVAGCGSGASGVGRRRGGRARAGMGRMVGETGLPAARTAPVAHVWRSGAVGCGRRPAGEEGRGGEAWGEEKMRVVAWLAESRGRGRYPLSAPGLCASARACALPALGRRDAAAATTIAITTRLPAGMLALTPLHGTAGRQWGVGARGKRKCRRVHMQRIIMGVLERGRFFPGHGFVPEGGSNAQSQVPKP